MSLWTSTIWTSPIWTVVSTLVGLLTAIAATYAAFEAQRSASAANSSVRESKRAADIMESEMKLGQRAWLGVDQVKFLHSIDAWNQPSAEIVLKNSGLSPALNPRLAYRVVLHRSRMDENDIRELLKQFNVEAPFAPNTTLSHFRHEDRTLTAPEVNDLRNGLAHLYIAGAIEYQDIFGEKHKTEWAYEYNPGVIGDLSPLHFHNTMT